MLFAVILATENGNVLAEHWRIVLNVGSPLLRLTRRMGENMVATD